MWYIFFFTIFDFINVICLFFSRILIKISINCFSEIYTTLCWFLFEWFTWDIFFCLCYEVFKLKHIPENYDLIFCMVKKIGNTFDSHSMRLPCVWGWSFIFIVATPKSSPSRINEILIYRGSATNCISMHNKQFADFESTVHPNNGR